MVTVGFTKAEAEAAAEAMRAYIDDDYYPAIDMGALKAALSRLTRTIASQATGGNRSAHGSVSLRSQSPVTAAVTTARSA